MYIFLGENNFKKLGFFIQKNPKTDLNLSGKLRWVGSRTMRQRYLPNSSLSFWSPCQSLALNHLRNFWLLQEFLDS